MLSGFCIAVLEYCSAVQCLANDTHRVSLLLDRVVCRANFLTGVCLSVTLLIDDLGQYCVCFMYMIRFEPMCPLYGALSVPYVPAGVRRGASVARVGHEFL